MHVRQLLWDSWNIAHIARHNVTPEEVEQVCRGDYETFDTYKGRILVIDPTITGHMLAIILNPKGDDLYYPVTARVADRKERRMYQEAKGGVLV